MKEQIEKLKTRGDTMDFFKTLTDNQLTGFICALEEAKVYIELTMRDDFLLSVAKSLKGYR